MIRKLMLGRRCFFDLIITSQNWRRADIWPMSEKMTFKTSRQTVRKLMLGQRRYFDLIMISQNWRRADIGPMLGKMAFITSRQTVRKLMLGRCCFLDMNYDIGKLTSGRHLTDVGKDEIHDKSANDQKIDVGPTLFFRPNYNIAKLDVGPTSGQYRKRWHSKQVGKLVRKLMLGQCRYFDLDYDIAKLTSGRHRANVGKDGIHNKSANDQKIDVGPMLFFGHELWYREIDIGPTSGQMTEKIKFMTSRLTEQKIDVGPTLLFRPDYDIAKIMSGRHLGQCRIRSAFITSRQTVRKLMLGRRCFVIFTWIMISQNWRRADIGPVVGKDGIHNKSANDQKIDVGPMLFFGPVIMISGNWRWADIWPMSEKMKFMTRRLTDQKIDVGPGRCVFRPDYDIAKIMSGRHLASVGKDDIHNKSANCQKIDVGPTLLFRHWLWYRKTDIGPISGQMLGKMAFITSRQTDQKTDVGPMLFFWPELWYRKNWRRADIWPCRKR